MKINDNEIVITTKQEILDELKTSLEDLYGASFYIKSGGVIDGFVNTVSDMEFDLQDNFLEIIKNYNPEDAVGIWQDALYERIGVKRLGPKKTVFTIGVLTEGKTSIKSGEIRIQGNNREKEFANMSDFTANSNGYTYVDFVAVEYGDVDVDSNDNFSVISAPISVLDVDNTSIRDIQIGKDRESDDDFRIRFRQSKAINASATRYANVSNLSKFVDSDNHLNIIDKKSDNTYSPMEVKIVANPTVTDNIFAEAVFATVGAGIKMLGDTEIIIKDLSGRNVKVKFQKAKDINIEIFIELNLAVGFNAEDVYEKLKENIISYAAQKDFGLGSIVYANEFVIPSLQTDGVNMVNNIKIKRVSDINWTDIIHSDYDEIPVFSYSNITITEGL